MARYFDPKINEALTLTEITAYTPDELMAYEKSWDAVRAGKTLLIDNYTKGMEEGVEKGREEEREKAYQEKLQIARNLLLDGLKPASVAKNTELTLEIVLKLQESLKQ